MAGSADPDSKKVYDVLSEMEKGQAKEKAVGGGSSSR